MKGGREGGREGGEREDEGREGGRREGCSGNGERGCECIWVLMCTYGDGWIEQR